MDFELLLIAICPGILLTIIGWYYRTYPPKKINWIYGYRTKRAMANQQVWEYANKVGGKMIWYFGLSLLTIGILSVLLLTQTNVPYAILFGAIVGMGYGIFWCERQLDNRFDKNGELKGKA